MVNRFGNVFEYDTFTIGKFGKITFTDCVLLSTQAFYSNIVLEVTTGTLSYYHKGSYFGTFNLS